MRSLVTSIFLYACESWTLTAELSKKNTSHGNEVLPQDTTHLIKDPVTTDQARKLATDQASVIKLATDQASDSSMCFTAGHDTTASSVSWVLYSLCEHPKYQEKVQQEIDTVLQGRDSDDIEW